MMSASWMINEEVLGNVAVPPRSRTAVALILTITVNTRAAFIHIYLIEKLDKNERGVLLPPVHVAHVKGVGLMAIPWQKVTDREEENGAPSSLALTLSLPLCISFFSDKRSVGDHSSF